MSEPTEADQERARRIVAAHQRHEDLDELRAGIARALAAEREKARAPFLALAAKWESQAEYLTEPYLIQAAWVIRHIRRAAVDPQ